VLCWRNQTTKAEGENKKILFQVFNPLTWGKGFIWLMGMAVIFTSMEPLGLDFILMYENSLNIF